MCKAPVKMSPPINQRPVFFTGRTPFLSPNKQRQSTERKALTNININTRFFPLSQPETTAATKQLLLLLLLLIVSYLIITDV